MTLDTDDGGRLHVLVPGGYRGQARAFAANFAGPPSSRRLAERLPTTEGPPDTSDETPRTADVATSGRGQSPSVDVPDPD